MNQLLRYLIVFLNVLQIPRCQQVLSNVIIDSQSEERAAIEEAGYNAPVIVNVKLNKHGVQDMYVYRNIPKKSSRMTRDTRKCGGSNCKVQINKRPASKPYPTNVHCRGVLVYCKKDCLSLNRNMCTEWPFLCPGDIVSDLVRRCNIQCVHNFRQMRIKFPVMPFLSKDANPRYDRFDYQ